MLQLKFTKINLYTSNLGLEAMLIKEEVQEILENTVIVRKFLGVYLREGLQLLQVGVHTNTERKPLPQLTRKEIRNTSSLPHSSELQKRIK
jgi:hypothetical protein